MKNIVWVLVALCGLAACDGDSRPTEPDVASAQDLEQGSFPSDDDWGDENVEEDVFEDDPELGVLRIKLAGEQHETQGYCSLQMTRMQGGEIATLNANLTVQAFDAAVSADAEFGELSIGWGTDSDKGMRPMSINYQPPTSPDTDGHELGWVHDKENPAQESLAIAVDGEPYNFATGDFRGADRAESAPHLWQTTFLVLSNLINPSESDKALRGQGSFKYDGLCTVSIRVLDSD